VADWDEFYDSALVTGRWPTASDGEAVGHELPPELASVIDVALPDDPVEVEAWRRGVARLAGIRHEHVVAVRATHVEGRTLRAELEIPPRARSLRDWIPVGHRLTPGEAVTLGTALARGLAALHQAGACRGGQLSISDVIVDSEGRPMWRFAFAHARGVADPASDVAALAEMVRELLAVRAAPGPLTLALLRAEDDDALRRPTSAQFADALIVACPADPLRQPQVVHELMVSASTQTAAPPQRLGAASLGEVPVEDQKPKPSVLPPRPARRDSPGPVKQVRSKWRFGAMGAVALIVLLGVLRGMSGAGSSAAAQVVAPVEVPPMTVNPTVSPSVAPPAASGEASETEDPEYGAAPSVDPVDAAWGLPSTSPPPEGRGPELPWAVVLEALDALRANAFGSVDAAALSRADAAGSSALATDLQTLEGLRAAGLKPRGFALDVVSVDEVRRSASEVTLVVLDRRRAYELVDSAGVVRGRRPARGEAQWRITLVSENGSERWRIRDVVPLGVATPTTSSSGSPSMTSTSR